MSKGKQGMRMAGFSCEDKQGAARWAGERRKGAESTSTGALKPSKTVRGSAKEPK